MDNVSLFNQLAQAGAAEPKKSQFFFPKALWGKVRGCSVCMVNDNYKQPELLPSWEDDSVQSLALYHLR